MDFDLNMYLQIERQMILYSPGKKIKKFTVAYLGK